MFLNIKTAVAAIALSAMAGGAFARELVINFDDLNPGPAGCAGVDSAGADAMVKVEIPDGQRLFAETSGTHAIYLMTDCSDARTCVDGTAEGPLTFLNDTGRDIEAYVVIDDLTGRPPTTITDVTIDIQPPYPLPDTCDEAIAFDPLVMGDELAVWGDLETYANDLDLSDPGPSCAPYATWGREAMVPVRLEAGETVEVTMTAPGSDPVLYFLTDCADTSTSLICADDTIQDEPETLSYTNETGAPIDGYIILDTLSLIDGPYYYAYYDYYWISYPGPTYDLDFRIY